MLFGRNKTKQEETQRAQFMAIISMANEVANRNPRALPTLVRLLAKPTQADCMLKVIRAGGTISAGGDFLVDNLWFGDGLYLDNRDTTLARLKESTNSSRPLSLASDVLLAYPWNRERLVDSMCSLGYQIGGNKWKQDLNHKIEYWLPWGIGWVGAGHHSLTIGILDWSAELTDYKAYDLSRVFEYVECDGSFFKRRHDGTTLAAVKNVEFAAIFEIGRLMAKHRVSA